MSKESKRQQYMSTYSGRALLEKHSLTEKGTWEIYGEDPNCDFGGHHHSPRIGTAEGTLDDVIEYAVELPAFWQWGAGGDIRKVAGVVKVDVATVRRRKELNAQKAALESQIAALQKQLTKLGE